MKQVFHHYTKWEDWQHGMWAKSTIEDELLAYAIWFTGDHVRYGIAMMRVVNEWPYTCEHNLTDNGMNQRAFIGRAAVCLELGIPEYIVRSAWWHLTKEQQDLANNEADKAIKYWKYQYAKNQVK